MRTGVVGRSGVAGIGASIALFALTACPKIDDTGTGGMAGGGAGGGVVGGGGASGAGGGGASGDAGLTWFTTCGDPVCRGAGEDAGREIPDVAPCTTQQAGQPCSSKDQLCDPRGACHEALRCSDHDPKMQPGGCPISSRRFKADITYLGTRELARISEQVGQLRLARYRYKDDPAGHPHLGFILEDSPTSPAADPQRERVDLYAYLSMVVAALQTQNQKLEVQRKELDLLRRELVRLRQGRPGAAAPASVGAR